MYVCVCVCVCVHTYIQSYWATIVFFVSVTQLSDYRHEYACMCVCMCEYACMHACILFSI